MDQIKYVRHVPKISLCQVRDGGISFTVDKINRPKDVYEAVLPFYRGADREIMSVLCLDSQNQPACFSVVSVGDLNTTRTSPRELLKIAVLSNARGLILVHNHPSGCLDPSAEDREFTQSIEGACKLMGIELYDHLIVTDNGFCSFRERGLIS